MTVWNVSPRGHYDEAPETLSQIASPSAASTSNPHRTRRSSAKSLVFETIVAVSGIRISASPAENKMPIQMLAMLPAVMATAAHARQQSRGPG